MAAEAAWDRAGRYAAINRLRVDLTSAVLEGRFEDALEAGGRALDLVNDSLSEFVDLEVPEAVPHTAQAFAILGDLGDLGVLAVTSGRLSELQGMIEHAGNPLRVLIIAVVDALGSPAMAARRCLHSRPSYDGNCLSRPPCPST